MGEQVDADNSEVEFSVFYMFGASQVAGHNDGLTLMENSDPLLLLVSLPLVPLGLVLGKMVGDF